MIWFWFRSEIHLIRFLLHFTSIYPGTVLPLKGPSLRPILGHVTSQGNKELDQQVNLTVLYLWKCHNTTVVAWPTHSLVGSGSGGPNFDFALFIWTVIRRAKCRWECFQRESVNCCLRINKYELFLFDIMHPLLSATLACNSCLVPARGGPSTTTRTHATAPSHIYALYRTAPTAAVIFSDGLKSIRVENLKENKTEIVLELVLKDYKLQLP